MGILENALLGSALGCALQYANRDQVTFPDCSNVLGAQTDERLCLAGCQHELDFKTIRVVLSITAPTCPWREFRAAHVTHDRAEHVGRAVARRRKVATLVTSLLTIDLESITKEKA